MGMLVGLQCKYTTIKNGYNAKELFANGKRGQ